MEYPKVLPFWGLEARDWYYFGHLRGRLLSSPKMVVGWDNNGWVGSREEGNSGTRLSVRARCGRDCGAGMQARRAGPRS